MSGITFVHNMFTSRWSGRLFFQCILWNENRNRNDETSFEWIERMGSVNILPKWRIIMPISIEEVMHRLKMQFFLETVVPPLRPKQCHWISFLYVFSCVLSKATRVNSQKKKKNRFDLLKDNDRHTHSKTTITAAIVSTFSMITIVIRRQWELQRSWCQQITYSAHNLAVWRSHCTSL